MDVSVVQAIAQPALERASGVLRDEAPTFRAGAIDVFEDDCGLGDREVASAVVEDRELADRPETHERGPRGRVRQIDQVLVEGYVELVEPDEGLPAERRERMIMERQGHESLLR